MSQQVLVMSPLQTVVHQRRRMFFNSHKAAALKAFCVSILERRANQLSPKIDILLGNTDF